MLKQLNEKYGALVAQMRALVDANPNGFSSELQAQYDAVEAEITSVEKQIANAKTLEERERKIQDRAAGAILPNVNGALSEDERKAHDQKLKSAFRKWMSAGKEGLNPEESAILQQRYRRDNDQSVNMALTVTTTGGGYLVPTGFSDKLEEALKFYGGIASTAEIFETESGAPLPYPTANDTATMASLIGINTQVSETDPGFNNVIFNAYKFTSGVVLVPIELLEDSYFDIDGYMARAFGERFGRAWNHYGTVGTGSSQPTGLMVALASASQNLVLATGNTTTVTGDNLIDLEHNVDIAYRSKGKYMLNDGTLKILRKLKDSYGRYLWIPAADGGFSGGNPARLNGYEYVVNNDMAVPAANAYTIAFGDLSKFKVRQVKGYSMMRLAERYADYGQVGFIAFQRWDSNLLDAGTHPVAAMQQSAT